MKFGDKTSKNFHDVRKVFLETSFCVYVCFVEFYMFFFDEFHVRGRNLLYKHICVGNVMVNIPKDHPRVLEEGPILVAKTL